MAKPILFDTISREKFDTLSDEVKAKKNYQIKETTGKISRWIGSLINGGGGGGNNDFVVAYSTTDGVTFTADKTFADIEAAYEAGKNVKAVFPEGSSCTIFYLAQFSENMLIFACVYKDEGLNAYSINHTSANVISFEA